MEQYYPFMDELDGEEENGQMYLGEVVDTVDVQDVVLEAWQEVMEDNFMRHLDK